LAGTLERKGHFFPMPKYSEVDGGQDLIGEEKSLMISNIAWQQYLG